MAQAKIGDTVKVHYTGKFEDGTVFDTSIGRDPLQFKIGEGMVIMGFDQALDGMSPGESKTVNIPSEMGYGPRQEALVVDIELAALPPEIEPEVGQRMMIGQSQDQMLQVEIVEVTESKVVMDANHPLAGKALIFEIELVEIVAEGDRS